MRIVVNMYCNKRDNDIAEEGNECTHCGETEPCPVGYAPYGMNPHDVV